MGKLQPNYLKSWET